MKKESLGRVVSCVKASNLTAKIIHRLGSPFAVGLAYHGTILDSKHGIDNIFGKHTSYPVLKNHLTFIARHYRVLGLSEIVKTLTNGGRLPRKAVFITFDDGYGGNYDVAFPLLRDLGLPATFFIPTFYVESRLPLLYDVLDAAVKYTQKRRAKIPLESTTEMLDLEHDEARYRSATRLHGIFRMMSFDQQHDFLNDLVYELGFTSSDQVPLLGPHVLPVTWAQVRQMADSGMEIGSHTHHHIILGRVGSALAQEELSVSKQILETSLDQPCTLFCYPNGHYPEDGNDATNRFVKKAGYACATYMDAGITTEDTDPYFIRRYSMGMYSSMTALRINLSGATPRIKSLFRKRRSL